MEPWAIWLIIAAALVAAEVLSGDFFLLMVGSGAAAGAITAALGGPVWLTLVVFAVVSLVMVVAVRPVARRALNRGIDDRSDGARAAIGQTATVTQTVDTHGGRVKIGAEEWSAQAQLPFEQLTIGQVVRVVEIRGAHAVVAAEPDWAS